MSRKKVHIDKLFKEGLKNLSLFVSDRDFNAIDDKSSVFKTPEDNSHTSSFSDFELEITENDWLATKSKLDIEKNLITTDTSISKAFEDYTLEPHKEDWTITYNKYKQSKRRRIIFWWLSTGIIVVLLSSIGLYLTQTNKDEKTQATNSVISSSITQNKNNYESTEDTKKPSEQYVYTNPQETKSGKTTDSKNNQSSTLPKLHVSRNSINKNSGNSSRNSSSTTSKLGRFSSSKQQNPTDVTKDYTANVYTNNTNQEYVHKDAKNDFESKDAKTPFITMGHNKKVPKILVDSTTKAGPADVADASNQNDSTKKTKNKKTDLDQCPTCKSGLKLYVGLTNQIDYTNRYLGTSNNEIYNSIRKASDKSFTQLTTGLELGVIAKKTQIFTGFQYTQQVWNSNYNYTYKTYDSLPYRNTNGDTIGWFLLNPQDTTMNQSRNVTISKVQIPLGFTSMVTINNRLNFTFGASAIFGFNVSSTGDRLLNPANRQLYGYQRLKDQERTMSFSPALNFGLQYTLNKHWMIAGSLGGNYSLTSRFKKPFNVSDHPYSLGLNIKLLYILKP